MEKNWKLQKATVEFGLSKREWTRRYIKSGRSEINGKRESAEFTGEFEVC